MAEVIGAAASVVGLVGAAFSLIQEIRAAQSRVHNAPETLDSAVKRLAGLEQLLRLVRDEPALQTASVVRAVQVVNEVAQELKEVVARLEAAQQEGRGTQSKDAPLNGERGEKQLAEIISRIDSTRGELRADLHVANVGMTGNLQDGFRVAAQMLQDMNAKMESVLGMGLDLAVALEDREQTADGYVLLIDDDVRMLGLSGLLEAEEGLAASEYADDGRFYDNLTGDQARIMTGNIGEARWRKQADPKTAISGINLGMD